MKKLLIILVGLLMGTLWSAEYRIDLDWNEFSGECNGFISGTINNKYEYIDGVSTNSAFQGKLRSLGEGKSDTAKQSFIIDSNQGFFSFWIKDKFGDDDMNANMDLIKESEPTIKIYKNNKFFQEVQVPPFPGLACKVFELDAATGDIMEHHKFYPKTKIIIGRVGNALNDEGLEAVEVVLVDQTKNIQRTTTAKNGLFLFEVGLGKYDLYFNKENFIKTTTSVRMHADEMPREVIVSMSPEIDKFRIVLTWGLKPKDLDAHLSGPRPNGEDFHIWYRHRVKIGGHDFLDRDDTNSYGPETITIYEPAKGTYQYSVHDYSNRNRKNSARLSLSNAQVQIYGNNKLLAVFEIPPQQRGNCWHVFEINEEQEIIPINKMEFVEDESRIHGN
ncbi:MAG: hypothetical protein SVM86_02815 [Candidatus Cloacimonadota bacterium]|nr:hypothetical protein [Candidatus Cloacimonadota bacterium]